MRRSVKFSASRIATSTFKTRKSSQNWSVTRWASAMSGCTRGAPRGGAVPETSRGKVCWGLTNPTRMGLLGLAPLVDGSPRWWVMTHKCRGSRQSSRVRITQFIDSTQGEPKDIYKLWQLSCQFNHTWKILAWQQFISSNGVMKVMVATKVMVAKQRK